MLAVDSDRFGPLGFERSLPALETLREIFVDFEKNGYRSKLPENLREPFRNDEERFISYLRRLAGFDLRSVPNFQSEHDSFENEVQGFYQDFFSRFGQWINFFRQETERKSTNKQTIERERRQLLEARKQSEALLKELQLVKEETDNLRTKKGQRAAVKLASYFKSEVEKVYEPMARKWFRAIIIGYTAIILVIVGFAAYYTFVSDWNNITWQSALGKIIFFAALWYGLAFIIRNYSVNSHLAAINRHRAAVASTLEDFLGSYPSATGEMLQNATQAMFKNAPIGFISKTEKDSGGPVFEIINKIIGTKTESG